MGTAENIRKNTELDDRDEQMHELGYLCAYEELERNLTLEAGWAFQREADKEANWFRKLAKGYGKKASELRSSYIKKYHPHNPEPLNKA